MLHQALKNQIPYPEWMMLYDLKIPLSDPALNRSVRTCIKNIRAKYKNADKFDLLNQKIKLFPACGDWAKSKIQELEAVIYDELKTVPQTEQGTWRSIEFELIFNSQNAMMDFAKEMRSKRHSKFVTIKHDGSLRIDEDDRNGAICKEVVVSYRGGQEDIVRDVCAGLKDRAYVNNSCGTHVHFDLRGSDEKAARQYGRRIARCVPALRMMLPKSRRTSKYCLNPINDFIGTNNDRYSFVNLQAYHKYKTIEVRGHSGTINANKILNWIAICEKIMTKRIRPKMDEVKSVEDLIKIYKLDEKLSNYIMERFRLYNACSPANIPAPVNAQQAPEF